MSEEGYRMRWYCVIIDKYQIFLMRQRDNLSAVTTLPMAAAARNAAKSADHTLYHLAPQGFWKKFREYKIYSNSTQECSVSVPAGDIVAVNPDISSGVPIATLHRYPQPGSRPELYATPATKCQSCL